MGRRRRLDSSTEKPSRRFFLWEALNLQSQFRESVPSDCFSVFVVGTFVLPLRFFLLDDSNLRKNLRQTLHGFCRFLSTAWEIFLVPKDIVTVAFAAPTPMDYQSLGIPMRLNPYRPLFLSLRILCLPLDLERFTRLLVRPDASTSWFWWMTETLLQFSSPDPSTHEVAGTTMPPPVPWKSYPGIVGAWPKPLHFVVSGPLSGKITLIFSFCQKQKLLLI